LDGSSIRPKAGGSIGNATGSTQTGIPSAADPATVAWRGGVRRPLENRKRGPGRRTQAGDPRARRPAIEAAARSRASGDIVEPTRRLLCSYRTLLGLLWSPPRPNPVLPP